jgi:hypothetical protein
MLEIERTVEPAWSINQLVDHWGMSRNSVLKLITSRELKAMNLSPKTGRRMFRVRDTDRIEFEERCARKRR